MRTVALLLILVSASFKTWGQFIDSSSWDHALPTFELEKVEVHGNHITEVWQTLQDSFFIRANLYFVDQSYWPNNRFEFSGSSVTVGEILDALCQTYKSQWRQDAKTGIIWIFPEALTYEKLLPKLIEVSENLPAIPMAGKLWEVIRDAQFSNPKAPALDELRESVFLGGWTARYLNTYNYCVAIRKGTYSFRDFVNLCACRNPGIAFYAASDGVRTEIIPRRFGHTDWNQPSLPCMTKFWEREIGPITQGRPMLDILQETLASDSPRLRWAARCFCLATGMQWDLERGLASLATNEKSMWTALALVDISVRDDGIPREISGGKKMNLDTEKYLRSCLTPERLASGEPKTVLLSCLELVRAGYEFPKEILSVVRSRKFTPDQLKGIEFELARIASYNEEIRKMLIDPANPNYIDTGGFCDFLKVEPKIYVVKPGTPATP